MELEGRMGGRKTGEGGTEERGEGRYGREWGEGRKREMRGRGGKEGGRV